MGLLRAADDLRRALARGLEPFGLTNQQYNVLRILRGAGATGLAVHELADRMVERTPGVTRLVDRLVDAGWVERVRSGADRRVVACHILPEGQALLDRIEPAVEALDLRVAMALDPEAQSVFIGLLDRFREGVAGPAPAPDAVPPSSTVRSPTMSDVAALEQELNQAILHGKALEAFETYYADDVVMQEPGVAPFEGKDVNRKREEEFFGSVEAFHGAELISAAVTGDTGFSEWLWDVTLKGVGRIKMEQVARRSWKDGKVVHERFYYNKG